jgi:hypothetical protein
LTEAKLVNFGGSPKEQGSYISKRLAEAGIPGIKYLDQGSRKIGSLQNDIASLKKEIADIKKDETDSRREERVRMKEIALERAEYDLRKEMELGEATRNFVVFDDKLVTIKEKNGNPVEAAVVEATEAEKQRMKLSPNLTMLFKDAKSIGITEGEFAAYSAKIERAEQAILDKAVAIRKAEVAKPLTAEWKRNEATVKDEVTRELAERGPFAAEEFLRKNKIELKGENVDAIADDLAPLFGFETGEELRGALGALEMERAATGKGPKWQLAQAVKEETARRMEERYGDLAENIAKEARQMALSLHTFDVLADEVRILAKLAGVEPPLSRDELVTWAKQSFERSNIREASNWQKLSRAVERGGREAEKALLKGDFLEAFQAKQRQMLAATLAKESLGLQKEIDRVEQSIDRFLSEQSIKGMDQTHLEHIRQMLASVGLPQQFPPTRDLGTLRDFVADSEGQLAVAHWLLDGSQPQMQAMSVEQFREFADSLKSMAHVGRQAQTLESARGKADLQNVIFDIKKQQERFNLIEQPLNPSVPQRVKAFGRWVTAAHLLVERMLDYSDQFDPNGPLTTWLDRPLRDSNAKEIVLTEQVSKQLRALKQYTDSSVNDLIPNKLIPDTLSSTGFLNMDRGNLRQLMLHMGSRSNIAKVSQGFGVNEADLRRFVDQNAKEKDWKWVQGMWDLFAGLKVEADAMQLRDTGVPADTVEAVPFTTSRFGEFKGGYAPLVYDKVRSNIQGDIAAQNPIFDPYYVSATTPKGYTISRTQYAGPLDLTGSLMASKIQAMVHDIAFREAVRNASKLINNAEFMADMTQKWGREYSGLLNGWLKDIANVRNVDDSYAMGAARVMAGIRQNITSALIAFNPGTYMKHGGTAASMSFERVGIKPLVSAIKDLGLKAIYQNARDLVTSTDSRPEPAFIDALKEVTDPGPKGETARDFVLASSAVMRNRQRKFEDSIRGAYEQAAESGAVQSLKDARHWAMNMGRVPVSLSDTMSAMPTWLASYKAAIARGEEHTDAVFIADKDVSRAHGSNFIGDKPRVLRTGEMMRWVTPLYNFWNHMANNYFQAAWDIGGLARGREEPNANIRSLSNKLFWLVVIPIAIEEMAGPARDEHGDSLGLQILKATARQFGASIIFMRDMTNAAFSGYEPSIGLLGTVMKSISDTAKDIHKSGTGQLSKDWMIHSFTALGMLTGVGGSQVGKTGSFVKDLATGRERPRTFNEYRQGLRTGHSKARKH